MATVYGTNATKVLDPTPANITDPGELEGKVRVMTDSYEAAAVALGSTIHMGKTLPKGARILEIILAFDALGGSSTLAVGDSTDTARYMAAGSSASAGIRALADETTVDGLLYEIGTVAADGDIIITTAGASITGTVRLIVFYTCE